MSYASVRGYTDEKSTKPVIELGPIKTEPGSRMTINNHEYAFNEEKTLVHTRQLSDVATKSSSSVVSLFSTKIVDGEVITGPSIQSGSLRMIIVIFSGKTRKFILSKANGPFVYSPMDSVPAAPIPATSATSTVVSANVAVGFGNVTSLTLKRPRPAASPSLTVTVSEPGKADVRVTNMVVDELKDGRRKISFYV